MANDRDEFKWRRVAEDPTGRTMVAELPTGLLFRVMAWDSREDSEVSVALQFVPMSAVERSRWMVVNGLV